ncbi:MAG: Hint domain-containing protein [Rubellimicrobium sp.]|nr:Hint domain-containing protein [Rubellimicrobium sp.]
MPTTYTDQFFVMDPGEPPPEGTFLTVQTFSFIDNDDDGFIGTGVGDSFNGLTITAVWVNDTITVNIPGQGIVTITGVTFYVDGFAPVFTPTDGTILQDATFISSTWVTVSTQVPVTQFGPICFAAGTMIATPDGPKAVETLVPGHLVLTKDSGPRTVLLLSRETFSATGRNAPVRIRAGALGNCSDLVVSQQHRMLISDWRTDLYLGLQEVLVAAKHLVDGEKIVIEEGGTVEYCHILFDRHEIVWAAGIPSESLNPAHYIDRSSSTSVAEVLRLFPALGQETDHGSAAMRPSLKAHEVHVLMAG